MDSENIIVISKDPLLVKRNGNIAGESIYKESDIQIADIADDFPSPQNYRISDKSDNESLRFL